MLSHLNTARMGSESKQQKNKLGIISVLEFLIKLKTRSESMEEINIM